MIGNQALPDAPDEDPRKIDGLPVVWYTTRKDDPNEIIASDHYDLEKCQHKRIILLEAERRAVCRKCHTDLDLFWCLTQMKRWFDDIDYKVKCINEYEAKEAARRARERERRDRRRE